VVVWVKNLRARFCAFRLQPYIDAHLMRSRWLRPNDPGVQLRSRTRDGSMQMECCAASSAATAC
jgi:hypothetical protein